MSRKPVPDAVVDQVRNFILGKPNVPDNTSSRVGKAVADKIRFTGKTERNKKNGSYQRRFANQRKRVDWQHGRIPDFPWETCNGKKNKQGRTMPRITS